MYSTLLALALLLALTSALPSRPEVTPFASPRAASNNNRRGGDVDNVTAITITLVNSMTEAISTSIASNPGVGLSGDATATAGTLAPGASASIVAPQEWAGNVAVGLAKYSEWEMPSLVEAALKTFGEGYMMDLDVSYVNGFTVPITCTCNSDQKWLAGCATDLWKGNATCGDDGETDHRNSTGVCVNPKNTADWSGVTATAFFAPCQGKAYTYPSDDGANKEGVCAGDATCCVGTVADGCPAAP